MMLNRRDTKNLIRDHHQDEKNELNELQWERIKTIFLVIVLTGEWVMDNMDCVDSVYLLKQLYMFI